MLRVDPRIHAAAIRKAAMTGQSLNKWAEKILEQAAHV
jgi:predicted HicB family RNase H-like nuclease